MAFVKNSTSAFQDKLKSCSIAPGYRDAKFELQVSVDSNDKSNTRNYGILLNKDDSWDLFLHLMDVHVTAWKYGVIDAGDNEKIPPVIKLLLENGR